MIELKSGSFTMLKDAEPICEFNNVNGFIESEIEPYSLGQEVVKFNHEATFEAEMMKCSPLMAYTTDLSGRPLSIEYRVPILVQARWHKKPRINKKWLKRYGMKKDSILVKARADSVTFDTKRENKYELGYTMTLDKLHYEFRPDQMRRNLKMELCY
jgi:hypothetical protein